jgi:3-methyladenine DNA glycosylase AlkD
VKIREATSRLKAAGTEPLRKVYTRHGIGKKMYGVSMAELNALAKEIKTDHELAVKLWDSGNHDARMLATRIADPAAISSGMLDDWSCDLDNYVIADAFSSLAAKSRFAHAKFEKWSRSRQEFVGQAGWNVLTTLAMRDPKLTNAFLIEQIRLIESRIHLSANRVRHAMNQSLIAIGARNKTLRQRATAAANRIGEVEVDHGETGCKTPAAVPYIDKMWARREARAAKS